VENTEREGDAKVYCASMGDSLLFRPALHGLRFFYSEMRETIFTNTFVLDIVRSQLLLMLLIHDIIT